jgi:zinc protease
MISRIRSRWLFLAATILALSGLTWAQGPSLLTDRVPADPAISMGNYANGLRYYVRANKKPDKRAELRLVVRAGSILEEDDQQGLAHFVEHMAFNGTKNFPKSTDIVSFIESLGMRFGADLNAGTGFDETTYILTVPTDKPEVMDQALQILEDWAHNVSFDQAEIDKERGVVMEEWRSRLGAGARMTDKMFPILLKGSRYADRIPIGKPEILQNFKRDRLTAFYTDWYRPDLMAVVVVGDFDRAEVEAQVKKHFASLPVMPSRKARPAFDMPDHTGTTYAILSDKEMTSTSVEVDNLLPARPDGTFGAYRQQIVDRLFQSMLAARFSEMSRKPDSPFLFAGGGRSAFIARNKETASLFATVKEDGIERGLDGLYTELARIRKFGFTQSEFDRQKQNVLRSYEQMVAEKETRVSASRAAEYIRNYLNNESLPTADDELAMLKRFFAQITLDETSRPAKEWFSETNRMVIVNSPQKPGLVLPTEAKLAAVMTAGLAKDVQPYVDSVAGAVLLDSTPAAGAVAKTSTNAAAGITEWELSNGVKVVLKPTTFKQDEILFRATALGGTSLASDADYIPASTATAVVTSGGLGKFNVTDLGKVLTGKLASASPTIGELTQGMIGSASQKDLETMFQLIYLRFTAPRADPAAFAAQTSQMKTLLANATASPNYAFNEVYNSVLYQNHVRRRPTTPATVDQMNLDKSMAFYKERFSDASGFTFVFVGSFEPATLKPLVEKYLGSLPSTHRNEMWKDVGARMATGVIDRKVEKGIDPKSQTLITYNGPFVWDQTQRIAIKAMSDILQTRLLEVIREELGGTYGINAGASYAKNPRAEYTLTISWGCDPARVEALTKRVLDEVELFKTSGPTPKQLTDETEALLKEFETNSKNNLYLRDQLAQKYQYGEDPATLWAIPDYYKKIDAAMIQQAAKTYLNSANRITVTLMPEKK